MVGMVIDRLRFAVVFINRNPFRVEIRETRHIYNNYTPLPSGFCGEGGIRTRDTLLEYTHFPGAPLQPLEHLSQHVPGKKDDGTGMKRQATARPLPFRRSGAKVINKIQPYKIRTLKNPYGAFRPRKGTRAGRFFRAAVGCRTADVSYRTGCVVGTFPPFLPVLRLSGTSRSDTAADAVPQCTAPRAARVRNSTSPACCRAVCVRHVGRCEKTHNPHRARLSGVPLQGYG